MLLSYYLCLCQLCKLSFFVFIPIGKKMEKKTLSDTDYVIHNTEPSKALSVMSADLPVV